MVLLRDKRAGVRLANSCKGMAASAPSAGQHERERSAHGMSHLLQRHAPPRCGLVKAVVLFLFCKLMVSLPADLQAKKEISRLPWIPQRPYLER